LRGKPQLRPVFPLSAFGRFTPFSPKLSHSVLVLRTAQKAPAPDYQQQSSIYNNTPKYPDRSTAQPHHRRRELLSSLRAMRTVGHQRPPPGGRWPQSAGSLQRIDRSTLPCVQRSLWRTPGRACSAWREPPFPHLLGQRLTRFLHLTKVESVLNSRSKSAEVIRLCAFC